MPRNISGTYSLPAAYNPVVVDELITATWANTTLQDIASALTNSLDRLGNGGMLAAFRVADGTVSAPGLAFTNEQSTGLYRPSAAVVGFSILGINTVLFEQDAVTFSTTPRYALAPVEQEDLANKEYVDVTAFNTALPGAGSAPGGSMIWKNPTTSVVEWTIAPDEQYCLSILSFLEQ